MKLDINIWNKYLLGFTFLLSYLNVISSRVSTMKDINWYTFTPEAPISALFSAIIVFIILKQLIVKKTNILIPKIKWIRLGAKLLIGLLIFLVLSNLLSFIISISFGNLSRNFQPIGLVVSVNFGYLVNYFLYALIFMIYVFYFKSTQQEQQIKKVEQSLDKSIIKNLRTQLNPHFLFNNLNSLDELIHSNPSKASDFLSDFANLYRYCLKNSNETLIPLKEEMQFAQSYFDMMMQKYPNEYELVVDQIVSDNYLIPPFACQTQIENVIEHNRPKKGKTISISITIKNDYLTIKNNIGENSRKTQKGGRALKNLVEQYALLDTKPLSINNDGNYYIVDIPLLKK